MKNLFLTISLLLCLGLSVSCNTGGGGDDTTPEPVSLDLNYSENYVYIGDQGGNDFPDYTKQRDGFDENLCWAAAYCNVLESAGYIQDTRVCVNNTQEHFGNIPGQVLVGFNWYMKNYLHLKPANHRDWEDQADLIPYHIADSIEDGFPVMLSMTNQDPDKPGHAVSVFAYKWDQDKETFTFLVTDGDDSWHTRFLHVEWVGTCWEISSSGMYNTLALNFSVGVFTFITQ